MDEIITINYRKPHKKTVSIDSDLVRYLRAKYAQQHRVDNPPRVVKIETYQLSRLRNTNEDQ